MRSGAWPASVIARLDSERAERTEAISHGDTETQRTGLGVSVADFLHALAAGGLSPPAAGKCDYLERLNPPPVFGCGAAE